MSLPIELVSRVTSYLSTPDFCNFRSSCSEIEKKTFDDFANALFTTKQFMLTHTSLQALIDISQHKALGSRLKKLIIGTNVIPSPRDPVQTWHYTNGPREQTDLQKQHHWREYKDQVCLKELGTDAAMLARAFVCKLSAKISNSIRRYQHVHLRFIL
jgi:hypothetical protein